jgi:hypothetical protein
MPRMYQGFTDWREKGEKGKEKRLVTQATAAKFRNV